MTIAVETQNLETSYMLGKVSVHALRGVDLRVEAGDFLAVIAPFKSLLGKQLGSKSVKRTLLGEIVKR